MLSMSVALFTTVNSVASNFSIEMAHILTDDFKILFASLCGLYFIISIVFLAYGYGNAKELMLSLFFIVIISSVLSSNSFYKNTVDTVTELPLKVSGVVLENAFPGSIDATEKIKPEYKALYALDKLFFKMFDISNKLTPDASLLTIGFDIIYTFIVLIAVVALYVFVHVSFLCLLVISTICIHALIIIGGPVIFLASFKSTRSAFYGWIKALVAYSLITIFATIMLSFSIKGVYSAITDLKILDHGAEFSEIIPAFLRVILWLSCALVIILKSPDLASAITGTYPGSTVNITSTLGRTAGLAAGAYMGGAKLAASHVLMPTMTAGIGKAASAGFPGASRAYSALKGISGPATQ